MIQKHTNEEKENAVSLYQNGTPVSQLSAESGIPRSTIYRWIHASRAETEKKEKFTLAKKYRQPTEDVYYSERKSLTPEHNL